MAETVRADEAETFAAALPAKEYEYTAALEASVKDLKLALESALEERDAAREARTPALAKATAKYARVRDSLGSMLDRADKLANELREEKDARRHDRAESHLRRFADLVGFRIRTRHAERRLGALEGRNLPGGGAANGASEGELDLGDGGADSDDSHQSRLERVAQHTIGPVLGNTNPPGTHTIACTGAEPAYADSDAADAQADFRRPTFIGSIATGTVPIIGDRSPLCNLPNCPRRRWDTSHSYCGCTHATEHAAAVSCSLATGGSGTVGNAGTEREESSAARAEVDAQFFERTVTGATRAASDDGSCDLPGCQNVRIAGDTDDHMHLYCCRLHSQAHLLEPCDDPEKAIDGGAGVTPVVAKPHFPWTKIVISSDKKRRSSRSLPGPFAAEQPTYASYLSVAGGALCPCIGRSASA